MIETSKLQTTKIVGLQWFWSVPILFILDQVSKWWVLTHVSFGEKLAIMPSLNVTMAHNRGIAFSLFSQRAVIGQIVLISFIILICACVAVWLAKTPLKDKWSGISLSLILGGALGNLCDRLWHGYVIDFIDFYINTLHWYTFNLADCFITVGAIMSIKTVLFPTPAEN